ncbi:DUF3575 domain-containing protein [Bacteroides gallinarum]|uniref:DUF3575 domain-containing protein n=1 Tax=Bacteroides gallinarum TaxID=376806 RepID=UPI001F499B0C|nr:DUF3575 domain-containing protein [Bacteroides gallinarum]
MKINKRSIILLFLLFSMGVVYFSWDCLKSRIENSELQGKDEVIAILEEESRRAADRHSDTYPDNRAAKLKQLNDGKVWQQMNNLFFDRMRNAHAAFITCKREIPLVPETVTVIPDTVAIEPEPTIEAVAVVPDTVTVAETIVPKAEEWTRHLHLKTNIAGLSMAIANVAVEVDLAKHWSFTLPVYYSAWDYFKSTIKFRTFAVQPELRYWPSGDNGKFFAGAHFGLAYYNFTANGDYRYQDHDRNTPAIGGGVSVGYRLPISKDYRWRVEFSIGAGAYSLYYDKFHNTPNTKDGLMVESVKKTYWGIDQVAVSFSYTFDLREKGGKR